MINTTDLRVSGFGAGPAANGFIITVSFDHEEFDIEETFIATDKNHLSALLSGFIARMNVPDQPLKIVQKETRQ